MTNYKSEVPTTSSLGSMSELKWLTELRETLHLPECWFITGYKRKVTQEQPDIREADSKMLGGVGVAWSFCALSPDSHVFTHPEALGSPPFWVFMESSLHGQD